MAIVVYIVANHGKLTALLSSRFVSSFSCCSFPGYHLYIDFVFCCLILTQTQTMCIRVQPYLMSSDLQAEHFVPLIPSRPLSLQVPFTSIL